MEAWWTALDLFERVAWSIAIFSSVVFIIQMIFTFVGMDTDSGLEIGHTDMDSGAEGMPFQLFTFRNFINFLLGFGWTCVLFYSKIEGHFWLVLFATFIGCLLVALVMLLFVGLSRMTQSGNINLQNAVGLTATVYIPIKEEKKGMGKVQLSIQGAVREYDAITESKVALKTGAIVKVVQVIDEHILLVE